MSLSMMDFLSAIFFIVAGVWLLAAIVYSLMVLYFLRLRSLNLLHTIHDDEYGRFYIFPKCGCRRHSPDELSNDDLAANDQSSSSSSPRQYYISFGWIFRRYARHLNIDADHDRNTPRYKRSERREAVRVLLQQQRQRKKSRRNSKTTSPVALLPSLDKDISRAQCRDADGNTGNIFQRWYTSVTFQTNDTKGTSLQQIQCGPANENDLSCMENGGQHVATKTDIHQCCNNDDTLSFPVDEVPICSICLSPYDCNDDDDYDDCDDEHYIPKKLVTAPPSTTIVATDGSAYSSNTTVFQSSTCVHQFHMECILNWLQRKTNVECPCCRIPMIHDQDVWKTIQHLRKQKLRSIQKRKQQLERSKQHPTAVTTPNDDDHIDETTNSETEHEGLP